MCKASICSLLADVECLWLDVLIIFYCSKDSIYLYEYIRKNRQKSKITRYTNASLCDVENCSVQCEITEFTFEFNIRSIRITLIASNYQCVYSLLRNCVWLFGLRNDSNGTHNAWIQIIAKSLNFKQRRLSIYVNVHASSLKMFELPNRNSSRAITNRSLARSLARAHHTHLHTECITASSMCTCKTCSLIADLCAFCLIHTGFSVMKVPMILFLLIVVCKNVLALVWRWFSCISANIFLHFVVCVWFDSISFHLVRTVVALFIVHSL